MTKEETKKQSIEKINTAILIIQCKKEKAINKRISEVSGLSEPTILKYPKNMKDKSSKGKDENKKVSDKPKPVSDAFKHVLKRKLEIA